VNRNVCVQAVIEDYGYAHFVSVLAEYLRQFGLPAEAPTESESARDDLLDVLCTL
jgi:hypothetical protein